MVLAELAEKGADIDVLRQMVQFMAQRLMELDVGARCRAGYEENNPQRLNSRSSGRLTADGALPSPAATASMPSGRSCSRFVYGTSSATLLLPLRSGQCVALIG